GRAWSARTSRVAHADRSWMPERFRGGCPFGVPRWRHGISPGGVLSAYEATRLSRRPSGTRPDRDQAEQRGAGPGAWTRSPRRWRGSRSAGQLGGGGLLDLLPGGLARLVLRRARQPAQGHVADDDADRDQGHGESQARVIAGQERGRRAVAVAQGVALAGPQHGPDER